MSGRPETLVLTKHAIDRYHERWRPEMSLDASRAELEAALPRATFVEVDGYDLIYRTQRGALLVVANEGKRGVVRTVLPMGSKKTMRRPRR